MLENISLCFDFVDFTSLVLVPGISLLQDGSRQSSVEVFNSSGVFST